MDELFDMKLRAQRRDRAARTGPENFLFERAFDDCLDRLQLVQRRFDRALLIGCPDPNWPTRLADRADAVDVVDPGPLFANEASGTTLMEDAWEPPAQHYDLVLAIGTLDTVNHLPLALRIVRHALGKGGLFLGAFSGGETLPRLRAAMRAADGISGIAAPHVHPRIEAAALSPLLEDAGFVRPVVDVDRVTVSYKRLDKLIGDLRRMGATNVLHGRPRFMSRSALKAAKQSFESGQEEGKTIEILEILHVAAWAPGND